MNLREIITKHLEENGFDGLCGDDCGCLMDDLFPCEYPDFDFCEPGYKKICPGKDKCPNSENCPDQYTGIWCMTTKKPVKES